MTRRNLLALGGSLRGASLTTTALRVAVDHARTTGADADLLTVGELSLPMLDPNLVADEEGLLPPEVARLLDAVVQADHILVGTPIYGGTPSGAVKNLLDTLHLGKDEMTGPLHGKRVGVLAVGGGSVSGHYNFQRGATTFLAIACRNLGAWVEPRHVELSELAFDVQGVMVDALAKIEVTDLVDRLLLSSTKTPSASADSQLRAEQDVLS